MGIDRVCLGGDFTRRLWEAMPPPPEPKDGLAPPGVVPGMGIEGLVGPEDYPALVGAARGARLVGRRRRRRDERQPAPVPALRALRRRGEPRSCLASVSAADTAAAASSPER